MRGGLVTPFEGLGVSEVPCTKRLSVPGFFVKRSPFLAGRTVILRVKEAETSRSDPPVFNLRTKSVKLSTIQCTHDGTDDPSSGAGQQ